MWSPRWHHGSSAEPPPWPPASLLPAAVPVAFAVRGIISTRLAQKCRYVTLLQYFVIITLTWIHLPDEQEPDGGAGRCILKFYLGFFGLEK